MARYSTCTTLKTVAVTRIVVAADLLNIQDYSSKISRGKDISSSNSTAPVVPRYLRVYDRSFYGCVKQPSKNERLSVKKSGINSTLLQSHNISSKRRELFRLGRSVAHC